MKPMQMFVLLTLFQTTIAASCVAGTFGLLLDATEGVVIERSSMQVEAEFGTEVMIGDVLLVPDGSSALVVTYEDCEELNFVASGAVEIESDSSITTEKPDSWSIRKLPVCYQPESFGGQSQHLIAGTLMRGESGDSQTRQTMEALRQLAAVDGANNAELVSLIIYDLQNGNQQQARGLYEQLKEKNGAAELPPAVVNALNKQP